MFIQVSLNVLDNNIESLHISMSIATNTRAISMICLDTYIFLVFIPVIQCKLVGIIDGNLQIDIPVRLIQTINIRNFIVEE